MAEIEMAAIPQPEPGLTVETLIERAVALRPLLRAEQDATEARGHYSPEIHQALKDGGFYRLLQPKLFGGYELEFPDFIRVVMEIARGDPGSAWCFTLSASHALLIGSHWPPEAQAELFGANGGHFNSPHRAVPAGGFEKVEGGYKVNGTWTYASGIPISTHFIGAGFIPQADGPPLGLNFIVARDKIEVLADWGGGVALGMQGSGSNGVRLTDVFVPDRHVVFGGPSGPDVTEDGSVGARLHGNPMYLGQLGGAYQTTFAAILTGAARAAIDEYEAIIRTKTVMMAPHMLRMNDPESQRPLGKALALADIAEVAAVGTAAKFMDQCRAWGEDRRPITPADTFQLWSMAQEASLIACEAVDLLWRTAPVSAANRGEKLQRYFRDIQMYRIHPSAQPWVSLTRGQIHLGLPFGVFGLPPGALG